MKSARDLDAADASAVIEESGPSLEDRAELSGSYHPRFWAARSRAGLLREGGEVDYALEVLEYQNHMPL